MSMVSDDSLKVGRERSWLKKKSMIKWRQESVRFFKVNLKRSELWVRVNIKDLSVVMLRIIAYKDNSYVVHRDFEWRICNNIRLKWGFYFNVPENRTSVNFGILMDREIENQVTEMKNPIYHIQVKQIWDYSNKIFLTFKFIR